MTMPLTSSSSSSSNFYCAYDNNKLCGRPCPCDLDLSTLKVVFKSRVPILVFLGLCPRLRPDVRDRQTDRQTDRPTGGVAVLCCERDQHTCRAKSTSCRWSLPAAQLCVRPTLIAADSNWERTVWESVRHTAPVTTLPPFIHVNLRWLILLQLMVMQPNEKTRTGTPRWQRVSWAVYFSGFLCWRGGVIDKLGVQNFRSAWLQLINIGICGLMNKAIKCIIPVLCT